MIETFSNYLKYNRGLSENTLKAYAEDLRDFASFAKDRFSGLRWSTVTKQHIDAYVAYMSADEMQPSTIKRHISALRTFYKTCIALGNQIENPARFVSTPKKAISLPKTIEVDAIRQALAAPDVDDQAKAVIALIFETGMRLQETLDMQPSDIDPQTQSIRVRGKGSKERTVYYGELTKVYGRKWRPAAHTQRDVRHLVYRALRRFSKAPQLSPHALRHTFASVMLANGASMAEIRVLLGHEHLETTEIYAHLSNPQTRERYLRFAPTC